jgi:hypothetical protein
MPYSGASLAPRVMHGMRGAGREVRGCGVATVSNPATRSASFAPVAAGCSPKGAIWEDGVSGDVGSAKIEVAILCWLLVELAPPARMRSVHLTVHDQCLAPM